MHRTTPGSRSRKTQLARPFSDPPPRGLESPRCRAAISSPLGLTGSHWFPAYFPQQFAPECPLVALVSPIRLSQAWFAQSCSGLIWRFPYTCPLVLKTPLPSQSLGRSRERVSMQERCLSVDEVMTHRSVNLVTSWTPIDRKEFPAHKLGRLWKLLASEGDQWVIAHGRFATTVPPFRPSSTRGAAGSTSPPTRSCNQSV